MINVQVPIFPGFSNIGICPGSFSGIAVYILDKIEKTEHLSSELKEKSFKYLPYYQNHVYILFPDNDAQKGNVHYFGSDGDLQRHLHHHLGSRQLHGRYLNVSVSKEWVPHLTSPLEDLQFGVKEHSHKNITKEYKTTSMKTTKKNQNQKYPKKTNNVQNPKKIKNNKNYKKTTNIPTVEENLLIHEFQTFSCETILDDILDSVLFRSETRCSLCFVTHFPWRKVCAKVNRGKQTIESKHEEPILNVCPKLRGGASAPKFLNTDQDRVKNLLTILRSLNVFAEHAGHDKCRLPETEIKSSLCTFCLTRSPAIRANSLKGRNKINPVEVLGEDLEYLQSIDEKKGIQFFLENVFESDVLDTYF